MNGHRIALRALMVAAALGSVDVHAQARGPSAKKIQQDGQRTVSPIERQQQEFLENWGQEAKDREREEMRRAPELSASRLADMDAFLRRLPGRFRIEGEIERYMGIGIRTGGPRIEGTAATLSDKFSGEADCRQIGEGAGVNCIISASWRAFDVNHQANAFAPMTSRRRHKPTPVEELNTLKPAVLLLGLDTDPPGIRAVMVASDTKTNEWVGKLEGDRASLIRSVLCLERHCYSELEIISVPGSDAVSFVLHAATGGITVTLDLRRDTEAKLEDSFDQLEAR